MHKSAGSTALKDADDLFQEHYHVSSITVNPQWNDDQNCNGHCARRVYWFQTCSDGTSRLCCCEVRQSLKHFCCN